MRLDCNFIGVELGICELQAKMKPVVNVEEKIGKTVGRRQPPNPFSLHGETKADMRAWRRAFPTPFVPKGVYRFRSHEEADEWMLKMITRRAKTTQVS